MNLSLGFSPCPNDCFIFDALIHKKIDTQGLDFTVIMEDVEALNNRAFQQELDITKLSYHAFLYLTNQYALLNSGSALGFNCGPLLVQNSENRIDNMDTASIAIPGKYTTANFLLSLAYPNSKNKKEVLFSEIEEAVLSGKVDAGLLIHENRFTYEEKGLQKIMDLGEFWESLIHAPIPLGGIVVKRSIESSMQKTIDSLIKQSVEFAFANPESCMPFVKQHAQEMNEEVMKKHIALYVNEFSINLGSVGKNAIQLLFDKAIENKLIEGVAPQIFVS
ncbi:MAG: 1,4-dihydroxy-6-naphthoate synthase [Bacteroidetes bacterium]|jgi:1,4-dihydroxy-6-naphthoate synthase|nr:1,4-dihydroxy-6-naphthoate synthase [Bacteroidota bacterium]MDF2452715.1 1,4-dihydroxy-6-naphthoate synthase [Bacteroidota bacterium]